MTNPVHEHYIAKGNILPKMRDKITLPSALNLTGAALKFRYSQPGVAAVERTASIVTGSALPSLAAATSFDAEFAPITADTAIAGVFNYEWVLTPNGETVGINLPSEVEPETDGTPREFNRFEVTDVI